MERRLFLTALAATTLVKPAFALADYTPGLVQQELAAGKTVFVDFAADWCSTCRAQEGKIAALRDENPAYNENISFVRVDWDEYGNSELARSLNIPRRSTLVVLKGDQELGRIVAGTKTQDIKNLMDIALAAAVA